MLTKQKVTENRYFHDPVRNNSVAMISSFGNVISGPHGRITPHDAFRNISSFEYVFNMTDSLWQYKDWGTFLREYVSEMGMTHVMMNSGLWESDFHCNATARNSLVDAIKSTVGLKAIWRTTTWPRTHSPEEAAKSGRQDEAMADYFGDNILNVSWTRQVRDSLYWDHVHFHEPTYSQMNEKLLEMIGHEFPSAYQRQALGALLNLSIV